MDNQMMPTGTDPFTENEVSPAPVEGPFEPELSEFKILEGIAQGGMGLVYKVYDRKEGRIAALKVLNLLTLMPQERAEEIARFKREARLAMSLTHPNMVKAYRAGCEDGVYYYAMELVAGEDLGEIVDKDGPLTEEQVVDVALVIADILDKINERGLVHRDVKPDNILYSYDGTVKLCDYGLMRQKVITDNSITSAGISIGTPNYMSPEQAKGDEELDIRSDIYSLGITLFHLLCGKTPFEGSSVTLTLSRHIFERVPTVRRYKEDVSEALEKIIAKMTHKKASERYQDPKEIMEDLRELRNEIHECQQDRKNQPESSENLTSHQEKAAGFFSRLRDFFSTDGEDENRLPKSA